MENNKVKKQSKNQFEEKLEQGLLKNTINPTVLELLNQVEDIPYNGDNINSRD